MSDRRLEHRYGALLATCALPLLAEPLTRPDVPRAPRLSRREAFALTRRLRRIVKDVPSASLVHEHLVMLHRLLLVEPFVEGVVVECGSWKGASAAALSLGAARTDRQMHVFDTFNGLPEVEEGDQRHVLLDRAEAHLYEQGMFAGSLEEVRANIARHGDLERVTFHQGVFSETMPGFSEPVVLAFIDADLRTAVEDCLLALWPNLQDGCAVFVHEAQHHEIASLFYDEAWWRSILDTSAPGLAGAGSGLGLHPLDGFWRSSIGFALKNPQTADYAERPPVDIV